MKKTGFRPCALGLLLGWGAAARAGDLEVRSTGAAATVLLNDHVVGQTPLTLKDVKEGDAVLGFRDAPLGATAFTQIVHVPATGAVVWEVDLSKREARLVSPEPAGGAAAPASPAPAPVVAPPPKGKVQTGDLYVSSTPVGATVLVDGEPVDRVTPAMLRGLPQGAHHVEVRTACARASEDVSVTVAVITRAELTPAPGTGGLQINGTPTGALVLVDGKESGALPVLAPELACGDHSLAVRAPGFLETTRTLTVPAFETTTVVIDLRKEEFGTLVVDVNPLETAIHVDGVDVGPGPRTLENVATGAHHVEGTLDGYQSASADVSVNANQIARATLGLKKQDLKPPKPPKAPKAPKAPKTASGDHFPIGRVMLDSAVSVATLGAGYLAWTSYADAADQYGVYMATSDATKAARVYDEQVRPGAQHAAAFGAMAAAGTAVSLVLWLKTDF